ncbi:serine hydrolase domain-containing protein [Sphingobium sp.]|uniref:serine hydrolase domain-containing protein n=1 Tax=Sphingobium sp. TaxID=1912891 RepID=UPI0025808177|nr:serine hydrolase domain-containing protein [Sphingobium sp.]
MKLGRAAFGRSCAIMVALSVMGSAVAEPVCAQTLAPELRLRVDAAVRDVLGQTYSPSASIAIVRDGEIVYAAAYGRARLSPVEKATPATRYQLASLSKSLTAQALLLLEQDGKLDLDDPVSRWIPDLSGGDKVTVRQLLQHTAGFPDHYPQTYPAGPRMKPTTPDTITKTWGHHPLLFAPGSRFRYSNLNYVIAGRIAEKVSGMPLFAFLRQRVFVPLGMEATIDLDDIDASTPDLTIGYVRPALGALEPAPEEGRGWSFGAGQVVTTADDVARWDTAFLAGRLLKPTQAREEITVPTLADGSRSSYALGLFVSQRGGRTVYYHVGQGLGFIAINRLYPAEKIAIIVLTNDSSSTAFAQIADRLAYLIVPPTAIDAQARAAFRAVQAGRPDRVEATDDFSRWFDTARARSFAASLGPLGEPQSFDLRSEDSADGITTRVYDVRAREKKLRLILQSMADGKLESFDVQKAE